MQAVTATLEEHHELPQATAEDLERWTMVRSLVHEMRSVLTSAKIGAEVLIGPRADDAAYRRGYAEMIAEQTGRVVRLLEDFSELARPIPPETPPGEEIADLNVALDAAGRELSGLASHLEQEMDLSPSPAAALIGGHQGRVTQALRGLLEYFLVASPCGTRVEAAIEVTNSEAEAITVSLSRHSPPGSGAAEQVLDWSRISPAAARRIVEQHGGWLETAEGEDDPHLVVSFPRARAAGVSSLSAPTMAEADYAAQPGMAVQL